ncbi:MAG: hypothetical protein MAG551_02592 [Candidatus Scalindua arabica]|uniref:Transporter n=1 Tax=Candidatus Scalindua arabica TaxID=1127984 RepID=A0A941W4X6_9BACT|nr:hypothetical protein [Candidatus Scalindua arabica]
MSISKKIIGYSLFICAALVSGQQPDFNAGRPGATETSTPVPKGFYQLESGGTYSGGTTGNIMMRTGITDRLEVRFSFDDLAAPPSSVYGGVMGGLMFKIRDESDRGPETAFVATVSVPNEGGLSFNGSEYNLIATFSKSITHLVSAGWSVGTTVYKHDIKQTSDVLYTATLGYQLSEKTGVFIEMYGGSPSSDFNQITHTIDGGIMYQLHDIIQIDVNGGLAMSGEGEDPFFDIGFAYRLPN